MQNTNSTAEEDARALEETKYLLSLPEVRDSIIEGLASSTQEFEADLDW